MAATALTVSTQLEKLKVLFNRIDDVYWSDTVANSLSDLSTLLPLPVGSDGVSFDAGDPDITKFKLTNGTTWTTIADAGDADISFQVPSIISTIADKFQSKVTKTDGEVTLEEVTYKGSGYNFEPKKVTGCLVMRSQDKKALIILPNIEGYATAKLDDTGKPMYFNFAVTPLNNEEGVAIYYMAEEESAA